MRGRKQKGGGEEGGSRSWGCCYPSLVMSSSFACLSACDCSSDRGAFVSVIMISIVSIIPLSDSVSKAVTHTNTHTHRCVNTFSLNWTSFERISCKLVYY